MRNPCWTCVTSAFDINLPGLSTTPYCSNAMVLAFSRCLVLRLDFSAKTPLHHMAARRSNIWDECILFLINCSLIPVVLIWLGLIDCTPGSFFLVTTQSLSGVLPSAFTKSRWWFQYTVFWFSNMASFHPELESVTICGITGITLLIDPSSLVDGCTYLIVGHDTVGSHTFCRPITKPWSGCSVSRAGEQFAVVGQIDSEHFKPEPVCPECYTDVSFLIQLCSTDGEFSFESYFA